MTYELRSVPRDWVHPEGKALYAGHEYHGHVKAWDADFRFDKPDPADYMPDWLPEEAPCLQWYETVSEGTPISPIFESEAEGIGDTDDAAIIRGFDVYGGRVG